MSAETLGPPTEATAAELPRREPPASRIEWLIDNAVAYDELLRAIGRARRSVWISQLAFDPDCMVYRSHARGAPDDEPDDDRLLVAALVAASTARAVDVRVLLNASLLLDTAKPLRAFLARSGAARIRVRGISRFPHLLHAKILIVDEHEAFLLGSPFVNGYWDDARHQPVDERRPARELGGRPLHDVSARITGPAVGDLGAIFAELWNDVSAGPTGSTGRARDDELRYRPRPALARGDDDAIQIVRTAPRRTLPRQREGHTGILAAIEAGIAGARSLIYIEHQYLSAGPVIAALTRALQHAPALEVVIVLNQNPDVTAYRGWQNVRLREAGLLDHPRVGLFALWSAEPSVARGGPWAVNQVFVHSKVLTVDDGWATVGSANLDGVSLHSYGHDFAGRIGRRVFRHVRNFDVNAVIRADQGALVETVRELRVRLWCEHLGLRPDALAARPEQGWLALWRECAARNVSTLDNGARNASALDGGHTCSAPAPPLSGFVLPYSTHPTPAAQLADVGVRVDPRRLDVRFNPGWLEVHCSPNWVRNMFA